MFLIKKKIITKEKLPVTEWGCAKCGKHKPLYALGFHDEQTNLCKECLEKEGDLTYK